MWMQADICPLQVHFEPPGSLLLSEKNNFQLKHDYATSYKQFLIKENVYISMKSKFPIYVLDSQSHEITTHYY